MLDSVPLNGQPRHTLGFIRARLAEYGVSPKNKLGQNFLIDLNLLDVLVDAADLHPNDVVLEIGCGTGSLTSRLATKVCAVLGVEIDPNLMQLVRDLLTEHRNIELIQADVLRNKNALNPNVVTKIDEMRRRHLCSTFKLVANLPYAVATPMIANLLINGPGPDRMVVTVQWEIAERLTATVGTPHYGALAVLVQSVANAEVLRKLAPTVFWPRPQVDSAIVRIVPDPAKREQVGDVPAFRTFLRDLYVHKRKSLRAALTNWPTGRRDKAVIDKLLEHLGIAGSTRAEELDPAQHCQLWRAFA
jgi:16S rRNA (adenine1518-N6/adenine1519-N6)-dimethyltransferase